MLGRGALPMLRVAGLSAILALGVLIPPPAAAAAPDQAVGVFTITRYQIDGNSILTEEQAQSLVSPFAGSNRQFSDVEAARKALEAACRQRGYPLVRVILPKQVLNQGVVRLLVIEGRIAKVVVEGNQHFDDANIRRSVPALVEGQSPNMDAISASLRTANESPDKVTRLEMTSEDNSVDVTATLKVSDQKPWNVILNADNGGQAQSGRDRVSAMYENANLFGLDHLMTLQYSTTLEHPSDVKVFALGYHIPLYTLGDAVDFYAAYSNVNAGSVSAGIFDFAVTGAATTYGTRYTQNFAPSGELRSKLIYGLDYKAFRNGLSVDDTQLGSDVTVRPLSVTYVAAWSPTDTAASASASLEHNIGGGNNGSATDFSNARFGATPSFNVFHFSASLTRALPADWQFQSRLSGQTTSDALVPSEQFGVGGVNSLRGLNERVIAGDKGADGNLELYTPNQCVSLFGGNTVCRVLAFYDVGAVSRNHVLPGEMGSESAASVGLGMRVAVGRSAVIQLDYGRVVSGNGNDLVGHQRLDLRLSLTE